MMNGAILVALGLWYGWHRADALFARDWHLYFIARCGWAMRRFSHYSTAPCLTRSVRHYHHRDRMARHPRGARSTNAAVRADPLIQIHLKWKITSAGASPRDCRPVEQAILRRFPGSDVIIHQDPSSVVPAAQQGF